MKRIQVVFIVLFALIMQGCRKDFQEIGSKHVVFQLKFPTSYNSDFYPEKVPLTVKNNITGEVKTAMSDREGRVALDLIPGTYSLTASRAYTEEEADQLTGYKVETFVNANVSPVVIDQDKSVDVQLIGSKSGGLVVREFYFTGSRNPNNGSYLYDGFIEIYNNSNVAIRIDSLCIGTTRTAATTNTAASSPYNFLTAFPDHVYLNQVFRVPSGSEPTMLAPRQSFVVAIDGFNHKSDPNGNPNSPADLGSGIADYEVYWPYGTGQNVDMDYPDVPNMIHAFAGTTSGFDWNIGISGAGLILFSAKDIRVLDVRFEPNAATAGTTQYIGIPLEDIIDGVDVTANSTILSANKRLPIVVDAGMTYIGATLNGKSVRRKVKNVVNGETIFVDTNNSLNDFEINNTPSPRKWN